MTFQWPAMLFFLILVPLFLMLYWVQQRRRTRLIEQYGNLGLFRNARGRVVGKRRHIPVALFLVGLTILLLSLARPQASISMPRIEGNVLLAVDVSGSMAADDFKPTRMEAAKAAARAFVEKQPPSVKIGVIAFSDSGFAVQSPTNDQETIYAAIDRLTPQRGTAIAHGILASLNTLADGKTEVGQFTEDGKIKMPTIRPEVSSSTVIVLLSDGENNESPDPLEVAQETSEIGVRIYTVGIGSTAGSILKVDGFSVHTQLNETMLQQIAKITGGVYHNAASEEDLYKVYDSITPQLVIKPEKIEITAVLAGIGILIFLIGGALSLAWFSRMP